MRQMFKFLKSCPENFRGNDVVYPASPTCSTKRDSPLFSHYFSKQYTEAVKKEENWKKEIIKELKEMSSVRKNMDLENTPVVVSPYFPNENNFPVQLKKIDLLEKDSYDEDSLNDHPNLTPPVERIDEVLTETIQYICSPIPKKNKLKSNKRKIDYSFEEIPTLVETKISDYFKNVKEIKSTEISKLTNMNINHTKSDHLSDVIYKNLPQGQIKSISQMYKPMSSLPTGTRLESPYFSKYNVKPLISNREIETFSPSRSSKINNFMKEDQKNHTVVVVRENNLKDIRNEICKMNVVEIGFTICYSDGSCLLNKEEECKNNNSNITGIMSHIELIKEEIRFFFFHTNSLRENPIKSLFFELLEINCRKICFKGQVFISFIITLFRLDQDKINYTWAILDPRIASWLLDPDCQRLSFNLISTSLGIKPIHQDRGQDWKTYVCKLLIEQSKVLKMHYSHLIEQNLWSLFLKMETPLLIILAEMESQSIKLDIDQMKVNKTILEKRLSELEEEAYSIVGYKFQLNSPAQLRNILYDKLELDKKSGIIISETDTLGAKSTSESMLKLLSQVHPLPDIVLGYRRLHKLKSTYTDGILAYIKDESHISTSWYQCATSTGRITSSNPNLQAIPKHIQQIQGFPYGLNVRSLFVSRKGRRFLTIDFEHIELKIFAHLSKDERLIQLFHNQIDIFDAITQLRLEVEEIDQTEREKTKTLIYSLLYGAGVNKVADLLSISKAEAYETFKQFNNLLPSIKKFRETTLQKCRKTKELRSISGRKRLFPNINSSNDKVKFSTERQAVNFIVQGSAADICKATMINCQKTLKDHKIEAKLLLQIHDELLWEINKSDLEDVKCLIKTALEDTASYWKEKLTVPLSVKFKTGRNWGNMK